MSDQLELPFLAPASTGSEIRSEKKPAGDKARARLALVRSKYGRRPRPRAGSAPPGNVVSLEFERLKRAEAEFLQIERETRFRMLCEGIDPSRKRR